MHCIFSLLVSRIKTIFCIAKIYLFEITFLQLQKWPLNFRWLLEIRFLALWTIKIHLNMVWLKNPINCFFYTFYFRFDFLLIVQYYSSLTRHSIFNTNADVKLYYILCQHIHNSVTFYCTIMHKTLLNQHVSIFVKHSSKNNRKWNLWKKIRNKVEFQLWQRNLKCNFKFIMICWQVACPGIL